MVLATQGLHAPRCEFFSILSAIYNALIELKSTGEYLTGMVFKHKHTHDVASRCAYKQTATGKSLVLGSITHHGNH